MNDRVPSTGEMECCDGNTAAARVAYAFSNLIPVFPITPSTPMGELVDTWSSAGKTNAWGSNVRVVEMQSEAGAAATLHGAGQAGALTTTFTASQGLLLMIPNMYKIAGELMPTVIHVAARTVATHALSIYGDHSDVMAARATGFAMLVSGSVQEVYDMAILAHLGTQHSRVPFLHFFDGFRTSHEINKISVLNEERLKELALTTHQSFKDHLNRASSPLHPSLKGTAQGPDLYFQGMEAKNPIYPALISILKKKLALIENYTGRRYRLVEYYGAPDADRVIILMGSGVSIARLAADDLNKKGEKVGVLQVRLFRPFPEAEFLKVLPETVKKISVLDRCKEPGANGEPLYQTIISALYRGTNGKLPVVRGGRYGLSSKEFTPKMALAIFRKMTDDSFKNDSGSFTIGIQDDVGKKSISYESEEFQGLGQQFEAVFYGLGADGTVGANKNSIKIIGDATNLSIQGYFVYDSKKSGSRTTSHLRFGSEEISAPYLIENPDFVACHRFSFIRTHNLLQNCRNGAKFLLNSPYSADKVWENLPYPIQNSILQRSINFYVIDAEALAKKIGLGPRINTIMQVCFFKIAEIIEIDEAIRRIKEAIKKSYQSKGEEILRLNYEAVDLALTALEQVVVPTQTSCDPAGLDRNIILDANEFADKFIEPIMAGRGNELSVSHFPIDGTFPTGTAKFERRDLSDYAACWDPEKCIQCGRCVLVCPHAVLRAKRYEASLLENAPDSFKSAPIKIKGFQEKQFTIQVYADRCTACGLCHQNCPVKTNEAGEKAINLTKKDRILPELEDELKFFQGLPWGHTSVSEEWGKIRELQFKEPLFEFSGACAGCGETPYVRMASQLYGHRMLIANATGCSSIYGGCLPTTPWTSDASGHGPAWMNSLFEDNAEVGLGFALTHNYYRDLAWEILTALKSSLGNDIVNDIISSYGQNDPENYEKQLARLADLKERLALIQDERADLLDSISEHLVERSIWIIGGDGWAYDIGYGGLDHIMNRKEKFTVLVLDTEVYSNTGGQASKSTPFGAVAGLASSGKMAMKKDLGLMISQYRNVFVAQISLGADPAHALRMIRAAEAFNGPSLIIASSHCIAHGIEMAMGMDLQKLAVKSGFFPLFHYDPNRFEQNLNPFVLDSPLPTLDVEEYLKAEGRFRKLLRSDRESLEKTLSLLRAEVTRRWNFYQYLAGQK